MSKFNHGGVQPHSVGEHYPIIVAGYGDGSWRAEYGPARSEPLASASEAQAVAIEAHAHLVRNGPVSCQTWLISHGLNWALGKRPRPGRPVSMVRLDNGSWELTLRQTSGSTVTRVFNTGATAQAFWVVVSAASKSGVTDDSLVAVLLA